MWTCALYPVNTFALYRLCVIFSRTSRIFFAYVIQQINKASLYNNIHYAPCMYMYIHVVLHYHSQSEVRKLYYLVCLYNWNIKTWHYRVRERASDSMRHWHRCRQCTHDIDDPIPCVLSLCSYWGYYGQVFHEYAYMLILVQSLFTYCYPVHMRKG